MGEPFVPFDDESGAHLEPEEAASEGVLAAAELFFHTVAAGDARGLWEQFSEAARAYILSLGHERGMDFDLTSRLRSGTASEEEVDDFLGDLMTGIQKDLAGVDFSRLAFESKAEPEAPMQVRVHYLVRLGPDSPDFLTAVPAGSIVFSLEGDEWKIERLVPRPGDGGGERNT